MKICLYVGLSFNLSRRISDYFQDSIVKQGSTRAFRYFHFIGHSEHESLTIFILDNSTNIDKVRALEDYLIETSNPF